MSIGGKKRESVQQQEFTKKVGLFEANVIAINPDAEEYKEILDIELKEDSNATKYLGKTEDGKTRLQVDVWLEEVKTKDKFKVTFFLDDKVKESKDGLKKQYINSIGTTSWATDPNNLLEWFTARDYREAYVGEEEFYGFLRTWLGDLNYSDAETTLQLDWKKLMSNNLRELKSQINGEYCTTFLALATVKTVMKEDTKREYQNVYHKGFLPAYSLKHFRLVDFTQPKIVKSLEEKQRTNKKDLKVHEKFVLNVFGQYGCRDFFTLKDIKEYDPNENLVASDETISDDGGDF